MAKIDYLVKALQEMSNKMSPECHLTCGKKCKWVYFHKYAVEYIYLGTVKEVAILDGRRHRNNITRWLARELNEEEDAIAQLGENERDSGKRKEVVYTVIEKSALLIEYLVDAFQNGQHQIYHKDDREILSYIDTITNL